MVSGVIMSAILAGAFYFSGAPWDYFFLVVAAIIIKTMVTWSFLLFLSTFASPFVSLFVTISMYISAHGVYVLLDLSRSPQMPHLREIAQILSYLLPNFEALSQIKGFVGFPEIVPQSQNFFGLFVPAILYAIILLIAAALVFQKRKFQ
jgi:hypothetical protein